MPESVDAAEKVIFPSERAVFPSEFLHIVESELVPMAFDLHENENGPGSRNIQTFHRKIPHLMPLERRIRRQIDIIKEADPDFINQIQEGRALFFGAFHDLKQNSTSRDPGTIQEFRQRNRSTTDEEDKGNEMETYLEVVKVMNMVNKSHNRAIFVSEDVPVCRRVQAATIPEFTAEGTVIQPFLNESSPLEAILVGRADINTCDVDPDEFVRDGNNEFQELNIGITRAIQEAPRDVQGVPVLTLADMDYVKDKIRLWLPGQPKFARGRAARKEIELGYFGNEKVVQALKDGYFNKSDESIEIAEGRAADLDKKLYAQLLKLIGYV
jgi:hypothetical protein